MYMIAITCFLLAASACGNVSAFSTGHTIARTNFLISHGQCRRGKSTFRSLLISARTDASEIDSDSISSANTENAKKEELLKLLSTVPRNQSTSKKLTSEILTAVRDLEAMCPTKEDEVLNSLGGNWELIWTAQDKSSQEAKSGFNWIK